MRKAVSFSLVVNTCAMGPSTLEILGEALPVWKRMLNSVVLQNYKHISPEVLLHTGSSFHEKGLNIP